MIFPVRWSYQNRRRLNDPSDFPASVMPSSRSVRLFRFPCHKSSVCRSRRFIELAPGCCRFPTCRNSDSMPNVRRFVGNRMCNKLVCLADSRIAKHCPQRWPDEGHGVVDYFPRPLCPVWNSRESVRCGPPTSGLIATFCAWAT